MNQTAERSGLKLWLLAGDLLCFVVFAVIGLRSHEEGFSISNLVRVMVPFQAGWLTVSLVSNLRSDATPEPDKPRTVLATWLPAWVIGLVLRSLVFGRAFAPTFALITFIFNALVLLAWRCLLVPRLRRRSG